MTGQRVAECHPEKPHKALGLCAGCYDKGLKARNPAYKQAQLANKAKWVKLNLEKAAISNRRTERKRRQIESVRLQKRDKQLQRDYGITLEKYNEMLKAQNGVCAICGRPPKRVSLAVDHCHKTGKVRGLLCFRCNYGLSWLNNDPTKFRSAAEYLERYK